MLLISLIWIENSDTVLGSSSKQITLNFYNLFYFDTKSNEAELTDYAIEKFEKANPNIHINSYDCNLDDAMKGKNKRPDVGLTYVDDIKKNKAEICDLSSMAEDEKGNILSSTFVPLVEDKRQIGMPFCVDMDFFVYNKKIIKHVPKDFDELIAMAHNCSKNGVYGLNLSLSNYFDMGPWIKEFGDFGFKDINKGTTTFADKSMIDYFKVIAKLANAGICPPEYEENLFERGKVAFSEETPYENNMAYKKKLEAFDKKLGSDYAIMPFPSMNKNKPIKPNFSEKGLFITKNTKYKEAAEKFIKFMISKDIQDKISDFKLTSLPVNKNVKTDTKLKTLMDQVAIGEPVSFNIPEFDYLNPNDRAIADAFRNATNNILQFKLTPENAAKQAYNEVLTAVRKYNKQDISENELYKVDTTPPRVPNTQNREIEINPINLKRDNSSYFYNEESVKSKTIQIKDLSKSSSLYPYVEKLLNEGIISLDKSRKVNLGKSLTRNDFSKILWNLYFKQKKINSKDEVKNNIFKDVKVNDKFSKYILATKNCISYYKGKNGYYFKGDNKLTRETAAAAIVKMLKINLDYVPKISEYNLCDKKGVVSNLEKYVSAAIQNKLIDIKKYKGKRYFCPNHSITLGELVKFLQSAYEDLNYGKSKTTYGNSFFNVNSYEGCYACQSGNTIYFSDIAHDNKMYKANADGTGVRLLLNDSVQCINSDRNWVYCILNKTQICRIKNDGTMEKVIYSINKGKYENPYFLKIIRIKDKLYCLQNIIPADSDGLQNTNINLVSINMDGSGYKVITNDYVEKFVDYKGYIYYINASDYKTLYRIKPNGTSVEKISDKFSAFKNNAIEDLQVIDGNLVIKFSDNRNFYTIDMNKNILTMLNENNIPATSKGGALLNVVGEWIYYERMIPNPNYVEGDSNSSPGSLELWRKKLDGSKDQRLNFASNEEFNEYIINSVSKSYISKQ